MAKKYNKQASFVAGISDSLKSTTEGGFAFGRAIDFRSDPFQVTINPKTERQAGSLIVDLPMWMDLACSNLYAYGNTGNVYLKDSNDTWSIDQVIPNSSGNGLVYFPEDEYLYATSDTSISRKSRACESDGVWYDSFLETEGGEPTNTQSITFLRASSQYASIADNASLSITDDISLEAYIKFTSLPATSEIQTIISKWNEASNQRSYKFDLTTASSFFGDGRDGALTIATNTTEDPIDANCTGTSGQYTLTTTNEHASFSSVALGDKVLIIQSRGTNAGLKQEATVQSYSGGVLTLQEALTFSPAHSATSSVANKAQVRVLKQYTNVTINSGVTYSAKAWDGLKGGIIGWYGNGSYVGTGLLSAAGKGYIGGAGRVGGSGTIAYAGEGTAGETNNTFASNGNGSSGAYIYGGTSTGSGGSGGGHALVGDPGVTGIGSFAGQAGNYVGAADLSTAFFGGAGGGAANTGGTPGAGGNGGGIILLYQATITSMAGGVSVNGDAGVNGTSGYAAGGGGAAGSLLIKCQTATFNATYLKATGGHYGYIGPNRGGGNGSYGRIAVYNSGGVTQTNDLVQPDQSEPELAVANIIDDPTLAASNGYVLRLLISSNGTNSEIYTQNVTTIIETDKWYRWAVTWDAPTSTANFYLNGALLGTQVGTLTSIYDSTARFAIATSYSGAGAAENFLNAQMDDARVWNSVRSATELAYYNDRVLVGTETNNSAYYKFDGNVNDSQTYTATSNLTATNTPTYSTDVPFSGVTTRADQDINIDATGSTYTLGTSLNEGATHRQTFAPTKEPIKSLGLNINTVGTGNWTVVVHDGLNREIATMTVANAQLHTGFYEFIFASSFRPILTANYHVHVYSTVGDGIIVTSGLNDMEGTTGNTGAYLATFFQILVSDIYHPVTQFLNFMVIGNERYVAKLEAGSVYNPHQLVLPAGYRVRCFAKWNEYLAIGVWKGTSITDTDQGKVFLWDGSSDTAGTSNPNTIVDVLEGGVNAMNGAGGILSIMAGYEGKLLMYGGGETQKMDQLPLVATDEYAEVAPGAMTMWRSLLYIGATINTDSTTLHQGVYGYGRLNVNYPRALGFDYPLSLGDQQSSLVKVGCVFPAGQSLYTGWQNGNTFGIDKVSVTNDCYATATLELNISDLGRMTQLKLPLVFRADFEPLVSGQSITLKYKSDREVSWRTLETEDTVGATEVRGILHTQVKEVQFAVDLATTSGVSPVLIQAALETEDQGSSTAL